MIPLVPAIIFCNCKLLFIIVSFYMEKGGKHNGVIM